MILPTEDILALLGPIFTLLILSFGFLQIYPRYVESAARNPGFSAEQERRTLTTALRLLKLEITAVAAAAFFILLYPIAGIVQRAYAIFYCSDEILLMLTLLLLCVAISFIVWVTWEIGIERLT